MSKYSQKMERHATKIRQEEKERNEQNRIKNEQLLKTRAERKMLRRNFKKMDKIEQEEKERTDEIINTRRALRERYLNSLKVDNLKILQAAKQDMLRYEIALKLEEQEDENVIDRN